MDLQPFTHIAHIPAGADLSTIRFAKAKLVKVATSASRRTDASYCNDLAFRDPGWSVACSSTSTEASAPACELTYSFVGQPLASDEYANRHFTFSVYFALDELNPDVRKALSGKKLSSREAAGYFAVNTHRESVSGLAIDRKHSSFCEGNFMDGAWTQRDPGCKDEISYTAIATPSYYVTVDIEPASPQVARAGLAPGE